MMSKLPMRFGPALTLGLTATAIAAEGGGGHGQEGGSDQPFLLAIDPGAAIWNLLMFIGLLVILGKFVWPHILQGLQAREQKIREDLSKAEQANEEAQRTLEQYKQQLQEAHEEARQLVEQAKADGEQARQRMVQQAEQEVQRIKDRATRDIEQAKQAAVQELHAHSAQLAVDVAGKILQRQITEEDTERLIDQSLKELESRQQQPA